MTSSEEFSGGQDAESYQKSSLPDTAAVGGTLGVLAGLMAGWQLPKLALAIGAGIVMMLVYDEVMYRVA